MLSSGECRDGEVTREFKCDCEIVSRTEMLDYALVLLVNQLELFDFLSSRILMGARVDAVLSVLNLIVTFQTALLILQTVKQMRRKRDVKK